MNLTYTLADATKKVIPLAEDGELIVGRGRDAVDVDLSPDSNVSRRHARLSGRAGAYWVEDLGSRHGTWINGTRVQGKICIGAGAIIRIGNTELVVEHDVPTEAVAEEDTVDGAIAETIAAAHPMSTALTGDGTDADSAAARRRLASLYELGAVLDNASSVNELSSAALERLTAAIPALHRVGLLVGEAGKLVPKAFLPKDKRPSYSLRLATRAMESRAGLIWRRNPADVSPDASVVTHGVQSAIYAPLVSRGETLGVVYADNMLTAGAFGAEDLRLMVAVANHLAILLKNNAMQRKIGHDEEVLATLLRPFPPRVAERLKRSRGRLRPGGERVEAATVLFSDVRGFTALSSTANPDDVMQLLNDMFYEFIPIIRDNDGTIDKYVGDAVLAVFGSPEPDEMQWEKAVRAAVGMQEAVVRLSHRWQRAGLPTLQVGIGIHSGELIHGFVGSPERMEYTVIGDTVNRASRYCDAAAAGEIAISPAVYQHVHRAVKIAPGLKVIRSKHPETEPDMEAYVVIGLEDTAR